MATQSQSQQQQEVDFEALLMSLKGILPSNPVDSICNAVRNSDVDAVTRLSHGIDSLFTVKPKKEAIKARNTMMLKFLLRSDSYITEELVVFACDQKDRECLKTLFEHGWLIDQPLKTMPSLLCTAIEDLPFTKFLVDIGVNPDMRSQLDESALSFAIHKGSLEVVHFLMERTDLHHGDLLHCAAQRENQSEGAQIAQVLINRGVDIHGHQYNNEFAFRWRGLGSLPTALHVACRERNIPVAACLLRNGAQPDCNTLGAGPTRTPRAIAQESGSQDLITLFANR